MLPPQVQAPVPPAPPATPAPGGPATLSAPTRDGGLITQVPRTASELSALRAQRSELSSQLNSAAGRRAELVKDLEGATGANRAGLEGRLQLLDQRILQIEGDIASTGLILASARGQIQGPASPPTGPNDMQIDVTAITAILSVFVLAPLALTYARNMWRKGSMPKVDDQLARENSDRLARLESAVDSIAIEVERISEGQRFVTKLLAETERGEKLRIEQPRS
jgi:hypothetical protein